MAADHHREVQTAYGAHALARNEDREATSDVSTVQRRLSADTKIP